MVTQSQSQLDKASSGPRPFSFPGVGSAGDSSDAQNHLQRPITSRFVEGSMNDRSSRAPPVSFLGASASVPADPADAQNGQDEQHGFGYNFTRRSLQMARPSFSSFRAGSSAAATTAPANTTTTTSNTTSSISTTATATSTSTTGSSGTLRRPRSFLAPFWEGVTKRLHRRARSTLETDIAKAAQQGTDTKMEDEAPQSPQVAALPTLSDRPSPDEVFANYQKLMEAGFFTKRAIPATRPGLSGAATPQNTPAPSCPDRFPPPPPRPAFLSNGTPLSPVAPSPTSTPMTTTPRGTKRIRADVDSDKDKDDAFKNVSIIAASEAPLSSPTRTPRKISKKLRKSSSRLPGGESLRTVAASEGANSRPSTAQSVAGSVSSRMTRSSQISQNVQVHQAQPPLPQSLPQSVPVPISIFAVPSTDYDADVVVSSSTGRNAVTKKHQERRQMEVKVVEVGRPEDTQEPRKKRRSQGPAVVHQVQQKSSFHRDSSPNVVVFDEEAQEEQQGNLRPPPTTHYHRPLGPHNPVSANRGSSNSRRAPRKPTLSSASSIASSATSASDEQAPISFHYPQRVRVRRPMQAQIVEVKASPAGKGRKRGNNALQEQQTGSYQSKPVTRASRGKNPLYSGGLAGAENAENAENEIPVWED